MLMTSTSSLQSPYAGGLSACILERCLYCVVHHTILPTLDFVFMKK